MHAAQQQQQSKCMTGKGETISFPIGSQAVGMDGWMTWMTWMAWMAWMTWMTGHGMA